MTPEQQIEIQEMQLQSYRILHDMVNVSLVVLGFVEIPLVMQVCSDLEKASIRVDHMLQITEKIYPEHDTNASTTYSNTPLT